MLRKIYSLVVVFLLIYCSGKAQQTPVEIISKKIADKMRDSLQLTVTQHDTLYAINVRLHNEQIAARQQYQSLDSVRRKIQRIENTRDSLYFPVLGSDKYSLYRSKKINLVNNN